MLCAGLGVSITSTAAWQEWGRANEEVLSVRGFQSRSSVGTFAGSGTQRREGGPVRVEKALLFHPLGESNGR